MSSPAHAPNALGRENFLYVKWPCALHMLECYVKNHFFVDSSLRLEEKAHNFNPNSVENMHIEILARSGQKSYKRSGTPGMSYAMSWTLS